MCDFFVQLSQAGLCLLKVEWYLMQVKFYWHVIHVGVLCNNFLQRDG